MIRPFAGHLPRIDPTCYIDSSAQILGQVALGAHSSVWMNAVLRGDVNSIHIGPRSNIQDCAVLHGMRNLYPVTVGEFVTIGHNATVHGCTLEDVCLIGIGAVVLNNARIGTGSIVAAGAVVPEHAVIPPHSLVVGVPARVKRSLGDTDLESILDYARNYIEYTRIYRQEAFAPTPETAPRRQPED